MHYDSLLGASLPEDCWTPGPSYLLRRARVLAVLDQLADRQHGALANAPPHKPHVLEIGAGAGALLYDIAKRGFTCTALETSPMARALARKLHSREDAVELLAAKPPDARWHSNFDFIFALEVLEHIEDDVSALAQWHSWLKPGGYLIMSVPAHTTRWSASDEWAGHFRRYEGSALDRLARESGFEVITRESWGVPLVNLIAPMRSWYQGRALAREKRDMMSQAEMSARSGTDRKAHALFYGVLSSPPGRAALRLFIQLQTWFAGTEWGDGYLLVARKLTA